MILRARLLPALLAATALFVAACASVPGSGSLENIESIQQQLLGDLPVPQGSRIDNGKSLILGSGPNWTGRLVIVAPQGPTDVFTFFRDQLPAAGWTGVSSVKAKTSILVFLKQERTITIEISETGVISSGVEISIIAAPKGGVPPAQSPRGK